MNITAINGIIALTARGRNCASLEASIKKIIGSDFIYNEQNNC